MQILNQKFTTKSRWWWWLIAYKSVSFYGIRWKWKCLKILLQCKSYTPFDGWTLDHSTFRVYKFVETDKLSWFHLPHIHTHIQSTYRKVHRHILQPKHVAQRNLSICALLSMKMSRTCGFALFDTVIVRWFAIANFQKR